MTDIPATRVCSKCGEGKPLTSEFWYRYRGGKYGFQSYCKVCQSAASTAWRNANRERHDETSKVWRQRNSDKVKACSHRWYVANSEKKKADSRRWRELNPERVRESAARYHMLHKTELREKDRRWQHANRVRVRGYKRVWAASHPEIIQAVYHRRRARKLALPDTLTGAQVDAAYIYFHNTCAVCGSQLRDLFGEVKPHLDHWIALSDPRPDNPGTVACNMLPLCSSCNLSKHHTDPIEWLNRRHPKKAKAILARISAYFASVRNEIE